MDSQVRTAGTAEIGVTGLAVMGSNLARNFAAKGFVTAIHNRSAARTTALIAAHGADGAFVPSTSAADFVGSLATPRKIVIMVKAGAPTDAVIDELAGLLEPGDILIDGGNAKFQDTLRREAALRDRGIHFVGCGISGGEEGALKGPSIMPGGSVQAYRSLGPILERIAAQVDGEPCCTHIGSDGAGHFVKMIHNGIEYADMQLIAEACDLLRRGAGLQPAAIADVFAEWNRGELDSFLIEITAEVLRHVDGYSRETVRGHRCRRCGYEGHRHLDRADRTRPRGPRIRDRRSGVRPRAFLRHRPTGRCGRETAGAGTATTSSGNRTPSSMMSEKHSTPRRLSRTPRAWT